MQRDLSVKISTDGQVIILTSSGGELLFRCEPRENLDRALDLLKKMNSLETSSGDPVYCTFMSGRYSAWTFSQSHLFWSHLRYFAKYEPLIEEVLEKNYQLSLVGKLPNDLVAILRLSGCRLVETESKAPALRHYIGGMLISVLAYFSGVLALIKGKLQGAKVIVYSPDRFDHRAKGDFRISAIYDFLHKNNIKYIEVLHTVPGRMFLQNLFSRRKPSIYLEYLPALSDKPKNEEHLFNTESFKRHERGFIDSILKIANGRASSNIERIGKLKRVLGLLKPKVILALDDMRYMPPMIVAARFHGVKVCGFQHGQFTKYHVDWMNYGIHPQASAYFDTLYVWNNYWKRMLLKYSNIFNEGNIEVSGSVRPLQEITFERKDIPKGPDELSLMVSFERSAPRDEVRKYLKRFLGMGVTLHIGVRPDIPPEEQLALYGLGDHPNIRVWSELDKRLLEKVDAVVGTYSTFLNDMMYYDLPVFMLDTSFKMGSYMLDDGLAPMLDINFEFDDILRHLKNFKSVKDIVWPRTEAKVEDILRKLLI